MGLFSSLGSTLAGLFGGGRAAPSPSPTKQSGTDGVYAFGGHLTSFETKNELKGRNLYTTYDKMLTTTVIVAAAVRYFQNLVGGTSWTITPKEGSPNGERAADIIREGLVEAQLQSMPWNSIVRKAALYRFYGFSAHEWSIRTRTDGMVVYDDIQHRPQYTVELWDVPEDGGRFTGFVQRAYGVAGQKYVWRDQMYYCVDNTLNDNPDGIGLLRHVTEHCRRLARYEQIEGFGYDGDLAGIPIARVPGTELAAQAVNKKDGWLESQTAAMRKFIDNHFKTSNQGLVLDSALITNPTDPKQMTTVPKWAIELIKSETGNLANAHQVIERLNREIARVLGMEFLLLGGDGKGSLALSRDKTSMFAALLEATLSELAQFATHDLVYPLLRYNGLDPEECAPKFTADPIATERVEAAVAALVGIAQAGGVLRPNDPAINAIRSRLHLPPQPEMTDAEVAAMMAPRMQNAPNDPNGGDNIEPDGIGTDDGSVDVDTADIEGDSSEIDLKPESKPSSKPKQKLQNSNKEIKRALVIMKLGKLSSGERRLLDAMQESEAA